MRSICEDTNDIELIKNVRGYLDKKRCAFVVGAGVTVGAVGDKNIDCSWKGLLKNGLIQCKNSSHNKLSEDWLNGKVRELESGDIFTYLSIAFEVESRIKDRTQGAYQLWLKNVIGKLKCNNSETLKEIVDFDNVITTTNYDGFLTHVLPTHPPITWLESGKVEEVLTGDRKAIIHLHGHYENPDSVILGVNSYNRILIDKPAQANQQFLAKLYHLLFVGFGAGLNDPNFELLFKWMRDALTLSTKEHFLILRERDVTKIDEKVFRDLNIQVLSYPGDYENLPLFLKCLRLNGGPKPKLAQPYTGKLPQPVYKLIGRDIEIARLKELIKKKDVNLLTLHGIDGIGKSVLALEVCNQLKKEGFEIFFISLRSISDSNMFLSELATSIGYTESNKFDDLLIRLKCIENQNLIFLLDDFEKVIGAKTYVSRLLNECPNLKFIVTSTDPLNIVGEHKEEVKSLKIFEGGENLPSKDSLIHSFPSINLFVTKAMQTDGKFALTDKNVKYITEACRLTHGIPLAIELLACIIALSPNEEIPQSTLKLVTAKWDKELMKAFFESSYLLLDASQKSLFKLLLIFEGGFSYALVQKLCQELEYDLDVAEGLRSLADRGLIELHEQTYLNGTNRYIMHDAINTFGYTLYDDKDELEKYRQKHAELFLQFVEEAEGKLTSEEREKDKWLERIDSEYDNIRVAMDWSQNSSNTNKHIGLKIAACLFWYWNLRGRLKEGFSRIKNAMHAYIEIDLLTKAKALYTIGGLAFLLGDYNYASECLQDGIEVLRRIENKTFFEQKLLGLTLVVLGVVKLNYSKKTVEEARQHLLESITIFEDLEDDWGIALAGNDLGRIATALEKFEDAENLYLKSLAIWQRINDSWGQPLTLICLGELMILKGQKDTCEKAIGYLNKALTIQRENDKWGKALAHKELGKAYLCKADYKKAAENFKYSLLKHYELNRKQLVAETLEGIAKLGAEALKQYIYSLKLLSGAEELRKEIHAVMSKKEEEKYEEYKKQLIGLSKLSKLEMVELETKGINIEQAIKLALQICEKIMD